MRHTAIDVRVFDTGANMAAIVEAIGGILESHTAPAHDGAAGWMLVWYRDDEPDLRGCWDCGHRVLTMRPDGAMGGLTDEIVCEACREVQP